MKRRLICMALAPCVVACGGAGFGLALALGLIVIAAIPSRVKKESNND